MRCAMIEQVGGCAQGQMSQWAVDFWRVLARLASLRRGGRKRPPHTRAKSPRSESGGYNIVWDLEENLQTQLHVEGFTGADAGGSVEVADGVVDYAAAWTCGS